MAKSEQLISDVARKIWPQGRPYAKYNSEGVIVGNNFRRLDFDEEHFECPQAAIGALLKRQEEIDGYEDRIDKASQMPVFVGAVGIIKGIKDRSLSEVGFGILSATSVWMGLKLAREVCDQTINNLENRIELVEGLSGKALVTLAPEE